MPHGAMALPHSVNGQLLPLVEAVIDDTELVAAMKRVDSLALVRVIAEAEAILFG